ncbi:MAG: hypothetical protein WC729_04785 [Sphingomonas sp.]|uniref:hypothetical protein n=1 Tax=Sphingomonas sp. TaxID=28214 RepID=UPI00356AA476
MLGRIFGKKRPAETISFLADVAQHHRDPTREAIAGGRYLLFTPDADGRAVLLLNTDPRLIASVLRRAAGGSSDLIVEWVCEASDDHRDHLAADNFSSCCIHAPVGERG